MGNSNQIACFLTCVLLLVQACTAQNQHPDIKRVGGPCQGCDLMFEGMPTHIDAVDTSAGWHEPSGQRLLISGNVFEIDGKTPASDVILYYWHTNAQGHYEQRLDHERNIENHGYLRGWIKTDQKGRFQLHTIRPASYPSWTEPAHIHWLIKEPSIENEYYIDEFVFDDDIYLTNDKRVAMEGRGGSGILRPVLMDGIEAAETNIVLGLNIPDYPMVNQNISGRSIGEDSPSFVPYHAFGPDRGTRVCPVCKYGRFLGLLYFVGDDPNWEKIKLWLTFLEEESQTRNNQFKVYFIYGGDSQHYIEEQRRNELVELGEQLTLKNVALTFVPSFDDQESEVYLNKINPRVANTFILYKQRSIFDKYVDLAPNEENFQKIRDALDLAYSPLFEYPETWTLKQKK